MTPLLTLCLGGLLFSPTGIGIGLTPGETQAPTDGKVTDRPGPVTAMASHEDTVWVGDANGRLRRFVREAEKLSAAGKLIPWKDGRQPGAIESILVTKAGPVWVALDDGTLAIATSTALEARAKHPEGVSALIEGPEGQLVSAGQNGEIRVWSAKGELEATIAAHAEAIAGLVLEPGKRPRLWSAGWDRHVRAFPFPKATRKKVGAASAGHRKGAAGSRRASKKRLERPAIELKLGTREPTALVLLPPAADAKGKDKAPRLLLGDYEGKVHSLELKGKKLRSTTLPTRAFMEFVSKLELSPSLAHGVAIASPEQTVLRFDPRDPSAAPKVLKTFEVPPARAVFLDDKILAVGLYDGTVHLVEVFK